MEINVLPKYDGSDNPTNCCPRFQSEGWDGQELHFKDKLFVKAKTRSILHIPLNMGSVFPRTLKAIEETDAINSEQIMVLSHDPSAWRGEHFFAVTKEVPGLEMVAMTGDFITKVFEGPYKNAPTWEEEMEAFVASKGQQVKKTYFFYTTCPKCAKFYGKNYVVAISEIQ
jgi:hypothetical protein